MGYTTWAPCVQGAVLTDRNRYLRPLVLGAISCALAGSAPGGGADHRVRLGGVCSSDLDCVEGSPCQHGTCELPGPCVETVTDVATGRVEHRRVHRYDAAHRQLGWTAVGVPGDEAPRSSEVVTWSADGAEQTVRRRDDDRDTSFTRLTRANGRVTLMLDGGTEADARRYVYTWHSDCHAADATVTDERGESLGSIESTCANGLLESQRTTVDRLVSTTRFEFDEDRRLRATERTFSSVLGPRRKEYVRHVDGYIVGSTEDLGIDGTTNVTILWDVSCWDTTDGELRAVKR